MATKTNKDIFIEFDKRLKAALTENYNNSGVRASGNAINSLAEEVNENTYILKGAGYWGAIDKGRGPNRTNTGGLRQGIYEWLKYKKYGFNWSTEKQRKSMSFAISKSIAKKGSYKFKKPDKRTKIIIDSIKESLPILNKLIVEKETITFTVDIENIYKNVAKFN